MSKLTPEQQSALALAEWLSAPPGTDPVGVDPGVVEAIVVLNPAFGLTPRTGIEEVLASVTSGPFAGPPPQSLAEVPTAVPANTGFRRAWLSWGGSSMLLLAAVAMFVVRVGLPETSVVQNAVISNDVAPIAGLRDADDSVASQVPAMAPDLDLPSAVSDQKTARLSAKPTGVRLGVPAPVAARPIAVPKVVMATVDAPEAEESEVDVLAKDAERATVTAAKVTVSNGQIRAPADVGQPAAIAAAERYLAAGEPGLAAKAARAGLALGGPDTPWRARLFTLLGDARHQLGDDVTAKEAYRQAVKLSEGE